MIVSICIPTYNRADILAKSCREMLRLDEFDSDVELVICDNCSDDDTPEVVEKLKQDFPDKNIIYHRNGENVRDKNFYFCLTYGHGLYRKLINDYTFISGDGIRLMKQAILHHQNETDCSLLFAGSLTIPDTEKSVIANGPDELVEYVYHHLTWISNFGVFARDLPCLEQYLDKWSTQLLQVWWILHLGEEKRTTYLYNFKGHYGRTPMPDSFRVPYNLFTALVQNYYDLLYAYRDKGKIAASTIRRDKTRTLKTFVGWSIRDLLILKEHNNYRTDSGWKICLKYFKYTPYFYFLFVKAIFKKIRQAHWPRLAMAIRGHLLNPLWLPRLKRREIRDKAFGEILENYMVRRYLSSADYVQEKKVERNDNGEKIFSIWFQGEGNAPDLIKSCFASIRKHCTEELVVLDEKSIFDYIELPEVIISKFKSGKIKYCHFADICRIELLHKYGGYWIDSTCFMTGPIPENIKKQDFFVFMAGNQIPGNYSFIQNCFIRARKESFLLEAWRTMILSYWAKESRRIDYFQHQVMFRTLVHHNRIAAEHFAGMPQIDQTPTHHIWFDIPNSKFDSAILEELTRQGYFYQKTTYRTKGEPLPGTFREYIVNYYK